MHICRFCQLSTKIIVNIRIICIFHIFRHSSKFAKSVKKRTNGSVSCEITLFSVIFQLFLWFMQIFKICKIYENIQLILILDIFFANIWQNLQICNNYIFHKYLQIAKKKNAQTFGYRYITDDLFWLDIKLKSFQ